MGLISIALTSASKTFSEQWKEYFYCEALPNDVLAVRGKKRVSGILGNKQDNIITDGSVIAVADGQCMIIVEQGKVIEACAEPGEYKFDSTTSASVFSGSFGEGFKRLFSEFSAHFQFAGEASRDQRIYYLNTKELIGNKFGTPQPIPFRIVDEKIGLDLDTSVKCFGEYSYRITNPILFYANVCGNVEHDYDREQLDSQLKSELLSALQPAFVKIAETGIRYYQLPGHTEELCNALNEVLSKKWGELRGLQIVSMSISSITGNPQDEEIVKQAQRNAMYRDQSMAAATLVGAQAQAMQDAAKNANGAAMGFMGVNMAQNAGGIDVNRLYQSSQKNDGTTVKKDWFCGECGSKNSGNFCTNCGTKKPE